MMDDALTTLLHRTLDRQAIRAAVTGSNIANVDTPGYRALQVRFPELLADVGGVETRRTDRSHLAQSGTPERAAISPAPITRSRADGNSVDIDREMTELARIQGRWNTTTQLIKKRFALLEYAATHGGRS